MKRNMRIVLILGVLVLLALAVGIAAAQDPEPPRGEDGPEGVTLHGNLGPGFTYQGRLTIGGSPANYPVPPGCDFQFSLWNAASVGLQSGVTEPENGVSVNRGLFNVVLNDSNLFGLSPFTGDERWLQIAVRCPAGGGIFTPLSPRQKLSATPYALGLRPRALVSGIVTGNGFPVFRADNTATSGFSDGIWGTTASFAGWGVLGRATAISGTTYGVFGQSSSPNGAGVLARGSGTTGTALRIESGAIKVPGAGVGASTLVFIHRAVAGNITNNYTVIDHPLTNGDANAILFVTPNWNPGGTCPCIYDNHPIGVFYTGTRWAIFNQDLAAMPLNAAFNVMVIKP